MNDDKQPLLEVCNIVKNFGNNRANDQINFKIHSGEIHALLGENGAGKSTLVKIIFGALQPNSGEIRWNNNPVVISSPAVARDLGIGMVFQHFSLFESLTVAENVSLALPKKFAVSELKTKIQEVSNEYGLPLEPDAVVADLSVGERQRIEIIRCLLQDPSLIIMDEPTSVLTPQEAEQLSETLQRLASEGRAILYISHRLEEVRSFCHHATILRHGKVVGNCDPRNETPSSLANLMVGATVDKITKSRSSEAAAPNLLELKNLSSTKSDQFGVDLNQINLTVRAGELVAIAGIAGNGQKELFDAISGEKPNKNSDSITIDSRSVGTSGITHRRKTGAAFVPEERIGHAAISLLTLSENLFLSWHAINDKLVKFGLLNQKFACQIQGKITKEFDVRTNHFNPEASSLSGGNLQKFVIGRELIRKPKLLVANQPTWGVDVGAATMIRQALIDLAISGSAVLVISQDLDEIFDIADRVAVISQGYLSEVEPIEQMTRERIGLLMGGSYEESKSLLPN